MPWRDVKPMDQRVLFIADYLRGACRDFTDLCTKYGISRKTGYKWVDRYQTSGLNGLHEQSRRPHHHPHSLPYSLQKCILELRQSGPLTLGPKKIQSKLLERFPGQTPPSLTTIHNVLKRAGLITPRRRRQRVPIYLDPFKPVEHPNDLWSVDFKGQFKLGNGSWCYPLTVMDHKSRYLLAADGLTGTGVGASKHSFKRLFLEYGLPQRIRSDNGVPFATRTAGGLSSLSIWWIKLGILPERILPGKPQQNGQHERMHRTLKAAVAHPASYSLNAQRRQLESFRQAYNQERPHEALQQIVPDKCYQPSPRAYPAKLPEITYPDYFEVRRVRSTGVVYWQAGQLYVSHLLQDEWIGMEEVNDGVWDVYFGPVRLGAVEQRSPKGKSINYWTIKV